MKNSILILIATLALNAMAFASSTGDALSVLNTFIATFAKDNPVWKKDIVLLADPANVPAGRQLGYSAMIGYYSFLPKTWEELTDTQKSEVYTDSRLKPFLVSLRNPNNYPTLTAADVPAPKEPVFPVEGLSAQPSSNPYALKISYPAAPTVAQELTSALPQAPAPAMGARVRIAPEEMLLDRPLKVYLYNNR